MYSCVYIEFVEIEFDQVEFFNQKKYFYFYLVHAVE